MKVAHLNECGLCTVPQIQHLPGIIEQNLTGKGQRPVLGRAVKQLFAHLLFEAPDSLADGRLRPI